MNGKHFAGNRMYVRNSAVVNERFAIRQEDDGLLLISDDFGPFKAINGWAYLRAFIKAYDWSYNKDGSLVVDINYDDSSIKIKGTKKADVISLPRLNTLFNLDLPFMKHMAKKTKKVYKPEPGCIMEYFQNDRLHAITFRPNVDSEVLPKFSQMKELFGCSFEYMGYGSVRCVYDKGNILYDKLIPEDWYTYEDDDGNVIVMGALYEPRVFMELDLPEYIEKQSMDDGTRSEELKNIEESNKVLELLAHDLQAMLDNNDNNQNFQNSVLEQLSSLTSRMDNIEETLGLK